MTLDLTKRLWTEGVDILATQVLLYIGLHCYAVPIIIIVDRFYIYSAVLRFRADSLRSHVILHE